MRKITTALKELSEAVARSAAAIEAEAARLDAASHSATGGKIMPVTMCKLPDKIRSGAYISSFGVSSMYGTPPWRRSVEAARQAASAARTDLEAQHAANVAALENNRQVTEQVKLIMSNLGIEPSRTTFGYATQRARKMTSKTVYAGYLTDLADVCKTSDMYEECCRSLEAFEKRIQEYESSEAKKEHALEQEKARANKARAQLTTLGALAHKYACTPDVDSVVSAMGRRCKYFHLGYWLERNRSDWHEGPERAQRGLDGFCVESALDQAIHDDILGRISNWAGDGRTFRDSPYGYDFLFAKVDEDLVADYRVLCSLGVIDD